MLTDHLGGSDSAVVFLPDANTRFSHRVQIEPCRAHYRQSGAHRGHETEIERREFCINTTLKPRFYGYPTIPPSLRCRETCLLVVAVVFRVIHIPMVSLLECLFRDHVLIHACDRYQGLALRSHWWLYSHVMDLRALCCAFLSFDECVLYLDLPYLTSLSDASSTLR